MLPIAISMRIKIHNSGELHKGNSILLYYMLCKLIKGKEAKIAKYLENYDLMPITISNIKSNKQMKEFQYLESGDEIAIRMTFLKDDVFIYFYDIFNKYNQLNKKLYIKNIPVSINKVFIERSETYKDLNKLELENQRIIISFKSPTCFVVNGKLTVLPDKQLILKSYYEKWNKYSNFPINENEFNTIIENCSLTKQKLTFNYVDFETFRFTGFKGDCYFTIKNIYNQKIEKNKLMQLLSLSRYCGTGHKTTIGMGQTKLQFLD